jgi:hypothetical protein
MDSHDTFEWFVVSMMAGGLLVILLSLAYDYWIHGWKNDR